MIITMNYKYLSLVLILNTNQIKFPVKIAPGVDDSEKD